MYCGKITGLKEKVMYSDAFYIVGMETIKRRMEERAKILSDNRLTYPESEAVDTKLHATYRMMESFAVDYIEYEKLREEYERHIIDKRAKDRLG